MLLIAYERICMLMIIDFDKNMFNKKKNKKKELSFALFFVTHYERR